jgi:hypothetical protein
MSEQLEYKNIFDAVTDDKDEAAKMKEHADLLLLRRRLEDFNFMCNEKEAEMTDINSIIEMITNNVRPTGSIQTDYLRGYDNACAHIIEQLRKMSDDDYHSCSMDAKRYRYIKENMVWHRYGESVGDADSHAIVGCKFPYLANFSCTAMLDYNIDKMIDSTK